jgi:phosphonate transport system substrate-binding protein
MRFTRPRPIHGTVAAATAAALLLTACGESAGDDSAGAADTTDQAAGSETSDDDASEAADTEGAGEANRDDWPETISYGVLPAEDAQVLAQRYAPFEDYLNECFDHPVELFTGTSYTAMIEAMRTGNIHIAKYGPFSFIIAEERAGAEPFVQGVQDIENAFYQSFIITRASLGFEDISDLEGASFAFVDAASASGHLFPRAFMVDELGITNDEVESFLGEVVFAGDHDSTALSVLNGDVDAGAVSDGAWFRLEDEFADHPNIDDMVILAPTADIPRSPETIQRDLPQSLKDVAAECFEAAIDIPELQDFLVEHRYDDGFVPVENETYDVVRLTASALELSPDDLLE